MTAQTTRRDEISFEIELMHQISAEEHFHLDINMKMPENTAKSGLKAFSAQRYRRAHRRRTKHYGAWKKYSSEAGANAAGDKKCRLLCLKLMKQQNVDSATGGSLQRPAHLQ